MASRTQYLANAVSDLKAPALFLLISKAVSIYNKVTQIDCGEIYNRIPEEKNVNT
jgi:hypothetical protein